MNVMRKLSKALEAVAPALATAVAGPVGPLALTAVRAVSGALGAPNDTKAEGLLKMLTEDGAPVKDLREADEQFRLEHAVELARLENQDKASARRMRVALGGDSTSSVLAYGMTLMLALAMMGLFLVPDISKQVETLLNVAIGGLLVSHKDVIGFYFGSSKGEHSAKGDNA